MLDRRTNCCAHKAWAHDAHLLPYGNWVAPSFHAGRRRRLHVLSVSGPVGLRGRIVPIGLGHPVYIPHLRLTQLLEHCRAWLACRRIGGRVRRWGGKHGYARCGGLCRRDPSAIAIPVAAITDLVIVAGMVLQLEARVI